MVAVFFGWFVLPSCHCQWEALLEGEQAAVNLADSATGFEMPNEPDLPCHCDDCPGKDFELTESAPQTAKPRVTFSSKIVSHFQNFRSDSSRGLSARGPPPEFLFVTDPEPRTFLRQLSLRL